MKWSGERNLRSGLPPEKPEDHFKQLRLSLERTGAKERRGWSNIRSSLGQISASQWTQMIMGAGIMGLGVLIKGKSAFGDWIESGGRKLLIGALKKNK